METLFLVRQMVRPVVAQYKSGDQGSKIQDQ
jgi:hypothetical protein